MHITTVVNRKGGVGKTTLVRNLAYLLAADYGKRVLMIDLDSSGIGRGQNFPGGSA